MKLLPECQNVTVFVFAFVYLFVSVFVSFFYLYVLQGGAAFENGARLAKCDCIFICICFICFKVVPHLKLVPECRSVTRQNCETIWDTNGQGKRVTTSNTYLSAQ